MKTEASSLNKFPAFTPQMNKFCPLTFMRSAVSGAAIPNTNNP